MGNKKFYPKDHSKSTVSIKNTLQLQTEVIAELNRLRVELSLLEETIRLKYLQLDGINEQVTSTTTTAYAENVKLADLQEQRTSLKDLTKNIKKKRTKLNGLQHDINERIKKGEEAEKAKILKVKERLDKEKEKLLAVKADISRFAQDKNFYSREAEVLRKEYAEVSSELNDAERSIEKADAYVREKRGGIELQLKINSRNDKRIRIAKQRLERYAKKELGININLG